VRGRLRLLALLTSGVAALAGCGSGADAPDAAAPSGGADRPVTVEHAFGSTEVPAEPQRVVAWGWGSADAAIALGVVPVAMPTQTYGGDEDGVLPWIRERLEQDGEQVPDLLPDAQEPPLEAIAAADPDVILAPYSGITEQEYELLSRIAPTVAYPELPWATPWRDTIRLVGAALGRGEQAEDLLAGIDQQVTDAAAAHPELDGVSVALVWSTPDAFYVYRPQDPRVEFTLDLGPVSAGPVEALAEGDSTFFYTLSTERLDELDSDLLVSFADTEEASRAFLDSPEAQLMSQVRRGAVAEIVGTERIAAVSPPTALSLTWGLDDYVAALGEAVASR